MNAGESRFRIDSYGRAFKGSRLQIQAYVNALPGDLNEAIGQAFPHLENVSWVSPLANDRFREYLDEQFLEVLGLPHLGDQLATFWPRRGPNWDGLAVSGTSVILVEAKSYPAEAKTRSGASKASLDWIQRSLLETSRWLGLKELPSTWWDGYYQGANRLAHLYFLREICNVDAYLAFVNIVNDPTHKPTGLPVWKLAEAEYLDALGIEALPPSAAFVYLPGVDRRVLTG